MDSKIIRMSILTMFACCGCTAQTLWDQNELTLFKNYALASCLAKHYKTESIYQDAIDTMNGSRARATIPLKAYQELNTELAIWQPDQYQSKAGNVSELLMCIDFQNSQPLLNIFRRYNPCENPSNYDSKAEFNQRCGEL